MSLAEDLEEKIDGLDMSNIRERINEPLVNWGGRSLQDAPRYLESLAEEVARKFWRIDENLNPRRPGTHGEEFYGKEFLAGLGLEELPKKGKRRRWRCLVCKHEWTGKDFCPKGCTGGKFMGGLNKALGMEASEEGAS